MYEVFKNLIIVSVVTILTHSGLHSRLRNFQMEFVGFNSPDVEVENTTPDLPNQMVIEMIMLVILWPLQEPYTH